MKNFLKTSLYLFAFAIAGILFQISCSNSDSEKNNNVINSTPIGKIIYAQNISGQNEIQLWTCNFDGTNQTLIPISLPPNREINTQNVRSTPSLSPDGQKVFFVVTNTTNNFHSIASCNIDGSNYQEIVTPSAYHLIEIGGAY
jgi:Tol biopolymer transport system component